MILSDALWFVIYLCKVHGLLDGGSRGRVRVVEGHDVRVYLVRLHHDKVRHEFGASVQEQRVKAANSMPQPRLHLEQRYCYGGTNLKFLISHQWIVGQKLVVTQGFQNKLDVVSLL